MHHGASSFGHTLADPAFPACEKPPLRRLCLSMHGCRSRLASVATGRTRAVLVSLLIVVGGCTSTSPRFRSQDRESPHVVQDEDEFRFASRIREEETREDDRKVDSEEMRNRLISSSSIPNKVLAPPGMNRDRFLLDLVSYLGVPYRYGGTTKTGLDCSGLTRTVYANAMNLTLPRSTTEQFNSGIPVEKQQLQFGDLVFFNTTGRTPSHVGIYIEADLFAHASVTSGVTFSSLESTYYRNRFVGARRIVR